MPNLEVVLNPNHPQASVIGTADWQTWFTKWATLVELSGSPLDAYELSLTLTTDQDIAQLNQTYRQLDQPTDVLSFAALEADFPLTPELLASEPLYLGDIIVSLDTAQQQAQEAGHSLAWEILWLTTHGFLHLLGWDHPDDASLIAMLAKQTELLAAIGWKLQN
jgi:probable rRNA maturation factor